ncbi:MAG: hypothetical protein JST93_12065 [Acidobacteria bacterium]|nr:hypothetical protein [Acidobacteriota bacterium]
MPQNYEWAPNPNPEAPGQPFVEPETLSGLGPYRHHLLASDGHRVPFPLGILRSNRYCRATHCRALVLSQSDFSGRRPGLDYVMEIRITDPPHVQEIIDTADALGVIVPTSGSGLLVAGLEALGYTAATAATAVLAGVTVLTTPNPNTGADVIWQDRVQISTGTVTVQYECVA